MTVSQYWYHQGDIVRILIDPKAGIWHKTGDLAEVQSASNATYDDGYQTLRLLFSECGCPKSRLHDHCLIVKADVVQIHPSSPRLLLGNRWENIIIE